MMNTRTLFKILIVTLFFISHIASAGINVSQSIIEFWQGAVPRQDIFVYNNGTERVFVEIKPEQVINPGMKSEKRVYEQDPNKRGLLVSPAKMILEPGERKIIRFARLDDGKNEKIFRTSVKPVPYGDIKAEGDGSFALKVLVGYDVLVILRPNDAKSKVEVKNEGDDVIFSNHGNTNAMLMKMVQCDKSGDRCTELPANRLYAGNSHNVKLPYGKNVLFYEIESNNVRVKHEFTPQ